MSRSSEASKLVERLAIEHGRAVAAVIDHLERDQETREDIWQEVFVVAFERADQLQGLEPGAERAWLRKTARFITANLARKAITSRRPERMISVASDPSSQSAEDEYFDASELGSSIDPRKMADTWSQLKTRDRLIIDLSAHGVGGDELGRILGLGPSACRQRLMRAKRAFLRFYNDLGGEPNDG